ncbi:hypothetical protein OSH07_10275 [Kaistia sp. K-TC2]|uniref:Uncharacterized protein n=1 Tax=Kaistia nematophila TaxID=2994654 RepID=A0A9X3E1B0_9HYPH|nr:hypothetical protein [Kaistia nematophila]MCX5569577.1 hypothetical protein [Kaistia nematophila]
MSVSKRDLEEALVDGATEGLNNKQLFERVRERYPKVKTSKIVRAAFHALSEPTLKDRNILDVIYALALKHRLDGVPSGQSGDDDDDNSDTAELDGAASRKSKAATLPLPESDKKRRKKGSAPMAP